MTAEPMPENDSLDHIESKFVGNGDAPVDTPESLLAVLASLREELAPIMEILKEAKQAKDSYNQDIRNHEQMIRDLKEKQRGIDALVWDSQKKMRDLESRISSTQRKFEEAESAMLLAQQYKELYDEFDRLTWGAPWREWAFDHQITGAKKLAASKRAILADKRGLGKTLTSLVWLDMIQAKKVIAVMPNDTQDNFMREIHHWAPHRAPTAVKVGNLPKAQRDMILNILLPNMDQFIIVINFEGWRRDDSLIDSLLALQPDAIIIDEAHYAKNRKTKAYKGLKRLVTENNKCSNCGSANIGQHEDHYGNISYVHCKECRTEPAGFFDFNSINSVLPMTGTPILNRPQDLYALLSLIDPVSFASENEFLYDYCQMDYYTNKWKFRTGGLERLTKELSTRFVMRDRNSAGITIPPQEVQYLNITLEQSQYPKQYAMLQALTKQAMVILNNNKNMPVPYLIALITRKRQATIWGEAIEFKDKDGVVVYRGDCDESVKLDRVITVSLDEEPEGLLIDMIGEPVDPLISDNSGMKRWVDGERVVIFSAFNAPLLELAKRMQAAGIPYAMLTGDTDKNHREEIINDFDARTASKDSYHYQVVLANYAVGGVGLNLNAASQIICLDEVWSPGKMDQAFGRIDRIGQERNTAVTVLRVDNSIDTFMAQLIEEKGDMIEGFETSIDLQQRLIDAFTEGML